MAEQPEAYRVLNASDAPLVTRWNNVDYELAPGEGNVFGAEIAHKFAKDHNLEAHRRAGQPPRVSLTPVRATYEAPPAAEPFRDPDTGQVYGSMKELVDAIRANERSRDDRASAPADGPQAAPRGSLPPMGKR